MKNSFKRMFVCSSCGATHPKWLGKCPDCGGWNTLSEEDVPDIPSRGGRGNTSSRQAEITPLPQVEETQERRVFCGVPELDRVLGGGIVPGGLVLLSGDPGIGKSTLLLQALEGLAKRGYKVLYASGEESCTQIKLRASRIGCLNPNILVTNETDILAIIDAARKLKPQVLVVDSIQTVFHAGIPGSPGNVTQIRECTNLIMQTAKGMGISTFVIGHVTKEGTVAGPKVLEHLVDAVIHLEGEPASGYRILRTLKNRFGSTGEIGVFAMQGHGLIDVPNPGEAFLDPERREREGSAISVSMEGSRPIAVELQVLVGKTTFATPRRLATGFDTGRFTILLAVLEKRAGLYLSNVDVYANITGGFKIFEPAVDLAVAAAVASSLFGRPIPPRSVFFGEVGLSGEIRTVSHALQRLQEARKLGFERAFIPARNYKLETEHITKLIKEGSNQPFFVIPIGDVNEVVHFEK